MVRTKKKEVQTQGLRPSQKAKAEKLRKKQEAKIKAEQEAVVVQENVSEIPEVKAIVETPQSADNTSNVDNKTSVKIINVKNAEGDPDTVAEILVQNKIDYTPKVSVVMPVYNVEPYLRQCLDSVVQQTLREIEIICVDDGSTDASLDILKEYAAKDNRITVITQKNLYAGVARNAGLAVAKGEYLSFLDSDDFFEPTLLEETYNLAEKEQSQIVFYQYTYYDNDTQKCDAEARGISKRLTNEDYITVTTTSIKDDLFTLCNPMPWNKLINRSLAVKEDLHFQALKASNDVCFSLNVLACAERITLYYRNLVYYRYNRRDSLKNTRDKAPLNFYEAYKGIYNTLTSKGLYEKYKKTFIISLISTSLWTLDKTDQKHELVKTFIRNKIIPKYIKGNEYILDKVILDKLQRVYHPDIIVSLTSYPARIGTVHLTIESILSQYLLADKVILWLAPEQFPNKEVDLPQKLLNLQTKGLTIGWYKDIRSYKKLIPTLQLYPNAIIVTADDDALYDPNWLAKLFQSYVKYPHSIQCHRAHKVVFDKKEVKPYKQWIWHNKLDKEYNSYALFFTGVGGVLYPPHCLSENVMLEKKFKKLCPQGDDIWFWANAIMNGTKIKLVENPLLYPKLIDGTQETALWLSNVDNNQNDIQIKKVVDEYPEIIRILNREKRQSILDTYILLPYYLHKIKQLKKIYNTKMCNSILQQISAMRIDIKNTGNRTNAIEVEGENIKIFIPSWFGDNNGVGQYIETSDLKKTIKIKIISDGILKFVFRGPDKKYDNKRISLWIDYKSIKVDNKEILLSPISIWHDKPYRYEIPVKDGQEITLEVEQKYHEYTENELKDVLQKLYSECSYAKDNVETIIGELRKKALPIIDEETKVKRELEKITANVFNTLNTFRIDVKNFGTEDNNIEVASQDVSVSEPKWFVNDKGIGKVLEGDKICNIIKFKIFGDGNLKFDFRSVDVRNGDRHIPILIDYKSIKIDDKDILSTPISVWHDELYRYEMPVKDGQEITLEVERQPHCYKLSRIYDIFKELSPESDYIKFKNDVLFEKLLLKKSFVYSEKIVQDVPQIDADLYVLVDNFCDAYIFKNKMYNSDKIMDFRSVKNKLVFNRLNQELINVLKKSKSICFVSYSHDIMTELYYDLLQFKNDYKHMEIYLCNIVSTTKLHKVVEYETCSNIHIYEVEADKVRNENLKVLDEYIANKRLTTIDQLQNLFIQKKNNNTLSDEENVALTEDVSGIKNIKILNAIETIDKIKEERCSISRYGDGEVRWMLFPNFKHHFQKSDDKMSERLREVFSNQNSNLLLCLAEQYKKEKEKSSFWKGVVRDTKFDILNMLHCNQVLGDANITRDPNYVPFIKEIWQGEDIVIVEGELSRMGVGNDLFDNAKSIKRILCPAENAFDKYDDILNECKKQSKDKLFLIALGPTASILAYDLANLGYWALDIGHIDICYEWKIRGAKSKIAIPGKYTNEVADGRENIEDCTDSNYLNSIIAKVV